MTLTDYARSWLPAPFVSSPTLADYAETWLTQIAGGKARGTVVNYRLLLRTA